MRFKVLNRKDVLVEKGANLLEAVKQANNMLDIPTSGALLIQVEDGNWLRIKLSEWGYVDRCDENGKEISL